MESTTKSLYCNQERDDNIKTKDRKISCKIRLLRTVFERCIPFSWCSKYEDSSMLLFQPISSEFRCSKYLHIKNPYVRRFELDYNSCINHLADILYM